MFCEIKRDDDAVNTEKSGRHWRIGVLLPSVVIFLSGCEKVIRPPAKRARLEGCLVKKVFCADLFFF